MIATFLLFSTLFQYENQFYLPLSRSELSNRFPVKYLGTIGNLRPGYFEATQDAPRPDKVVIGNLAFYKDYKATQDTPLPDKVEVGPSGAGVAKSAGGGLFITGKDKNGLPWNVDLNDYALAYACRFYSADLDRNGIRDLVLIYPTGGNGLAPTSHLLSLTFDDQGRPVPFKADGYFEESAKGITDLVDLNRDGRAVLIYMNFDDGYWITNLYEVRAARWRRVRGSYGRRSYPHYTSFTYRPNRKAVAPAPGRLPFAPDLSNKEPYFRGRLVSYKWSDANSSEDIELVMKTEKGQKIVNNPVQWYDTFTVVIDGSERRIISLLVKEEEEEKMKSVLNEIVGNCYQVSLYGDRRRNGSGSEILWVSH